MQHSPPHSVIRQAVHLANAQLMQFVEQDRPKQLVLLEDLQLLGQQPESASVGDGWAPDLLDETTECARVNPAEDLLGHNKVDPFSEIGLDVATG